MMSRLAPMLALGLVLAAGCSDSPGTSDGGPAPGTLGGPCLPGERCNPGLACRGGRCARAGDLGPADSGPPDALTPDARVLRPCDTVGAPCVSHDPCAITAICGEDRLCRPTQLQDCGDGLACTADSCLGLGLCQHTVDAKHCLVTSSTGGGAPAPTCVKAGAVSRDGDGIVQINTTEA